MCCLLVSQSLLHAAAQLLLNQRQNISFRCVATVCAQNNLSHGYVLPFPFFLRPLRLPSGLAFPCLDPSSPNSLALTRSMSVPEGQDRAIHPQRCSARRLPSLYTLHLHFYLHYHTAQLILHSLLSSTPSPRVQSVFVTSSNFFVSLAADDSYRPVSQQTSLPPHYLPSSSRWTPNIRTGYPIPTWASWPLSPSRLVGLVVRALSVLVVLQAALPYRTVRGRASALSSLQPDGATAYLAGSPIAEL